MAPTTTTLVGTASIKGTSEMARMVLLNFCAIGITFTWIVEMTYCTPYLLNLGLTKSNTSLIWIAGPLSGLVVQPIIGVIADGNTSTWGRRRPIMVTGAFVVASCLLILGFTKEIVGLVVPDETAAKKPSMALAILCIYVLDFAINGVMSCARSLIVDVLPLEKQQSGAAWAGRMNSVGSIIGYSSGAIDFPRLFGTTLGTTQFQQLTVVAAAIILFTTGVTCWAVNESVLVSSGGPKATRSAYGILRQIYSTVLHLPPRIRAICWVQFWCWIGWFPFMFYSTTWVSETYFRYDVAADAKHSKDVLGEMGRIGSSSLLMYSTIACAGAFLLPLFVKSPDEERTYTARPPQAVAGLLKTLQENKPDLLTMWIFGHLMFAGTMVFAPFATSFRFATVLVCLCAIPSTIGHWAPTAMLGVEVNKMSSAGYKRLSHDADMELAALEDPSSPTLLSGNDGSSGAELSGIYFGILNIYTTIPQFIGSLIAAVVFAVLEPGKSRELAGEQGEALPKAEGPNAIAVCLFIGAICTFVASFVTRRLKYL
ncbi:hypothetical protein E4U42_003574 [Claviceps africana]|uniref:Sucrose transporter n=1 Tax=Claviceps africana TaxID=83212 RepID=A0A8K0J6L8_9HYPO|nr:hypothetical protein E4U42_003574 [Claviceps africana]